MMIFSPFLAFFVDRFLQKKSVSRRRIFSWLIIITLPLIIIWILGYRYRSDQVADTIEFLFAFCVSLFVIVVFNHLRVKILLLLMITLGLGFFVIAVNYAFSFAGGKSEILKESSYENYTAQYIAARTYGTPKVIFKKSELLGIIEKDVLVIDLLESGSTKVCNYFYRDKKISLVYDLCNNKLDPSE
jgi:hypothetical protein